MRVQVYRNLRTGLWSVCAYGSAGTRGKLISSETHVALADCRMVVRESGRQYTLRKKERAVHAWIEGTLVSTDARAVIQGAQGATRVTYNPYRAGYFHIAGRANARVDTAKRVYFADGGAAYATDCA